MNRSLAVLGFLTLLLASGVWADSIWNVSSGDWNTAGNWIGGVPTSGTIVQVNSGTANITSADASSSTSYIGYNSGSNGTVNVTNTRTWTASGSLDVGVYGTGKLTIADGGKVTNNSGIIGFSSTGNGEVTVTGVDAGTGTSSLWQNQYGLYVGNSGTGKLTIADGGKVITGANYGTRLASYDSATGTLNLNGTPGSRGVLETTYIYEGTGTGGGHLNFNGGILRATADSSNFVQNFETGDVQILSGGAFIDTNGHNITISVGFQGSGDLNKIGTGTLTLTGASSYGERTYVDGGTLVISSGGTVASGGRGSIGTSSGSTGTMTVTGAGSQWSSTNYMIVGTSGTGTLNILAGGGVISGDASHASIMANDAGSQGTVLVDGSGSLWAANDNLVVGGGGQGTLTIQNSGKVTDGIGIIASSSGSTSSATVTGTGSQWINSDSLLVGNAGQGTLSILAGGMVSDIQGRVGYTGTGTGQVTVSGAGSQWINTGNLVLGYEGISTLTVADGGKVTASWIRLAHASASQGTLNLNGTAGSRGVLETAFIQEGSGTGGGHINFAGGILKVTADSTDFLSGFTTGDVQLNTGGAFFDTNGFSVTVVDTLQFQGAGGLTKMGAGTLTLAGGSRNYTGDNYVIEGTLANVWGVIAQDSGETGSMTVTGSGSVWQNLSALSVGHNGTGKLTVADGGKVTSAYYFHFIGSNPTGNGEVTVTGVHGGTGTSSLWQISGDLSVGYDGTGKLTVADGGKVTNAIGYIGYRFTGNGEVTVTGVHAGTGTSSLWQNSYELYVGYFSTGELTVADGGKVTTGAAVGTTLAYTSSATGTLNLNGTAGSRGVLETAFIQEGNGNGSGHLNFAGGILRATQNQSNFLQNFETGDVQINSGGAFLDTNGFSVTVVSSLQFAGTGGLTKMGAGTLTLDGNRNYTGDNFVIEGTLANAIGYLAQNSGETGSMTVTGTGSQWVNTGDVLNVGYNGNGTLNILNGGTVSDAYGVIGANPTGNGEVTVTVTGVHAGTGTSSLWQNSDSLYVGDSGTGKLTIADGGKVTDSTGYIGNASTGNGEVTVTGVHAGTGTSSLWQNSDNSLYVGLSGTGKLTIADGGKVTSPTGYIGINPTGNGEVTVTGVHAGTGTRSLWENSSVLYVGLFGTGKLTIADGGKVATGVGHGTYLAYQSTSTGTLNLNDTSGSRGVLETAYIYEGTGTGGGHLNFAGGILRATQNQSNFLQNFETGDVQINSGGAFLDSNGYNIGISTALEGAGGLTKQGAGTLTLTGASHYAGLTTLEEGTLLINGSITSDVMVKAGTILGGSGSAGAVTIEHGGFLSPGDNGPGTLHTLSETWMDGGAYVWDITTPVGTPGTQWDFVSITGTLDIAAMTGDKFVIDIHGSLSGLAGFAIYDWTILTASGGFGGTFAAEEFAFVLDGFWSSTGGDFSIFTSGNDLVLRYAAAPEPGRALLLLAGLGLLGMRRRR